MNYLFDKIKDIINKGGVLTITNKEGISLDITNDFRIAITEVNTLKQLAQMKTKEVQTITQEDKDYNKLARKCAKLELELNQLKDIKEWLDDERIRRAIYLSSPEGRMSNKLIKSDVFDPNSAYELKKRNKVLNNEIPIEKIRYVDKDDINKLSELYIRKKKEK